LIVGIKALALFAKLLVDSSSVDCVNTAVTAIVFTAAVIVGIVTVAITLPLFVFTGAGTVVDWRRFAAWLIVGIDTRAVLTKLLVDSSSVDCFSTAVTAIVFTTAVVILVVAVAITFPLVIFAGAGTVVAAWLTVGIKALTIFAKLLVNSS